MTKTKTASIAFQGMPGAFSHAAALAFARRMEGDTQVRPCQSFAEVFSLVGSGAAEYGAVPLENSSIGSIVANYDLLWENDAAIVAEYLHPVHHQLIGFPDTPVEDLRLVFSHPAALDQCRDLFKQHANLVARVHWDTSGSVLHVKESGDRSSAAIAGELAAKEYGMAVLLSNIEDHALNATRFGLIAAYDGKTLPAAIKPRGSISSISDPGFLCKESFAVELRHEVGALAHLLVAIAQSGANLTKIESRPIGSTPWHYRFFMDIEVASEGMETALLRVLTSGSLALKRLGRYLPHDET